MVREASITSDKTDLLITGDRTLVSDFIGNYFDPKSDPQSKIAKEVEARRRNKRILEEKTTLEIKEEKKNDN